LKHRFRHEPEVSPPARRSRPSAAACPQARFLPKGTAAGPGLPPDEPSGARKALDRLFGLPTANLALGFVFALSLVFPAQASKALLAFAYLYHLLAEALGRLF